MLQVKIDNYDRMRSVPQRGSAWVALPRLGTHPLRRGGTDFMMRRASKSSHDVVGRISLGTNGDSPVSNSAIARSAAGSGQESVAAPIPSPGRNK